MDKRITSKILFIKQTHIKIILLTSLSVFVTGCAHKGQLIDNKRVETLPKINTSEPESFLQRFKPSGLTIGSWLEISSKGSYFKPTTISKPGNALIYFYRQNSRWSQREIVSASIFLNNKKIHSLMNNHYYPIELPAGNYRLAIRRPLPTPPTSFQKGTVVDFKVEAGKTYYLKYAEQYHVVKPKASLGLLYKRPLIQMPEKVALREIGETQLKSEGYLFSFKDED